MLAPHASTIGFLVVHTSVRPIVRRVEVTNRGLDINPHWPVSLITHIPTAGGAFDGDLVGLEVWERPDRPSGRPVIGPQREAPPPPEDLGALAALMGPAEGQTRVALAEQVIGRLHEHYTEFARNRYGGAGIPCEFPASHLFLPRSQKKFSRPGQVDSSTSRVGSSGGTRGDARSSRHFWRGMRPPAQGTSGVQGELASL
jgi:hypothetical protein